MKLFELDKKDEFTLPYDVAQDCQCYMKNDPMFYRKEYYPVMSLLSDKFRAGEDINFNEALLPLVKSAMESYCKKYDLDPPQSVFTDVDQESIIERIKSEEIKNIEEGEY